jgi:hypothetical protein
VIVRPVADAAFRVQLEEHEADVLRRLTAEMHELLAREEHADPALQRLFPDAYEKSENASAYKDLVGNELRSGKRAAIQLLRRELGEEGAIEASVPAAEADAWLTALTDMRLAIGARLEVTEEKMNQAMDANGPDAPAWAVLHWLGWLQESILGTLGDPTVDQKENDAGS